MVAVLMVCDPAGEVTGSSYAYRMFRDASQKPAAEATLLRSVAKQEKGIQRRVLRAERPPLTNRFGITSSPGQVARRPGRPARFPPDSRAGQSTPPASPD